MMASESDSRPYMDKVQELRKKFLDKHYASAKNCYEKNDISRVKSDDLFVQQFLVGKEGNVDKAHKLMIEALKWRKDFGINDLTEKDIPEEILISGYQYTYGKDKKGASVVFTVLSKYVKGKKEKLLGYEKLVTLIFEKHQREHPGERLTLINYTQDATLSNVDMDYTKFLVNMQTTYYPDILENCYIVNFPKILAGIWTIVKGLLGSRLHTKYIFTTLEDLSAKYIDEDQLPLKFGGPSFEYKYPPEEKTDSNSNMAAAVTEATS